MVTRKFWIERTYCDQCGIEIEDNPEALVREGCKRDLCSEECANMFVDEKEDCCIKCKFCSNTSFEGEVIDGICTPCRKRIMSEKEEYFKEEERTLKGEKDQTEKSHSAIASGKVLAQSQPAPGDISLSCSQIREICDNNSCETCPLKADKRCMGLEANL
jgi:hypothetical protein